MIKQQRVSKMSKNNGKTNCELNEILCFRKHMKKSYYYNETTKILQKCEKIRKYRKILS